MRPCRLTSDRRENMETTIGSSGVKRCTGMGITKGHPGDQKAIAEGAADPCNVIFVEDRTSSEIVSSVLATMNGHGAKRAGLPRKALLKRETEGSVRSPAMH